MRDYKNPKHPFALAPQPPLEISARRDCVVFGAPVELVSLPKRSTRRGVPNANRPPFQANRAPKIIEDEAVWRAPGMALTGNAFPFADRHLVLWATERRREPSREMMEVAFAMADATAGTALINSMGAAASITRSHVHLLGEQRPFLQTLANSVIEPGAVHLSEEQAEGCKVLRLETPFPCIGIGLRGGAMHRARAMHHLLECRTTPSFNIIDQGGVAWLFPRSRIEITAPHFPQALGGAEIWGRWCFNSQDVFESITSEDMEQALRTGCLSWPED